MKGVEFILKMKDYISLSKVAKDSGVPYTKLRWEVQGGVISPENEDKINEWFKTII